MKSMFMRQFLSSAFMLLLSFSLIGAVFFPLCYNFIFNEKKDSLKAIAQSVTHSAMAYNVRGELDTNWDFRIGISSTASAANVSILACDLDGRIIACSDLDFRCGHVGKYVDKALIDVLLSDGEVFYNGNLDNIYDTQRHVVGEIITSADGRSQLGLVFVSSDTSQLSQLSSSLRGSFMLVAFAVLIISFLITTYTSQRQTRPLIEMAEAAKRFAHGQFNVRVRNYGRSDEVGQLAVAFNNMADSLERSETVRREFVSNISHELRTPMTSIGGFVDGILDGTIPPERQEEYLRIISSEISRLSRLVRGMLEASQLQGQETKLETQVFDICEHTLQTLFNFEQKAMDKKLEVETNIPAEPLLVVASPDSIRQVITNLLDNAVKFANEAGVLSVDISKRSGKVYVAISNTGETIPPREQRVIFDRFHKSDASRSKDKDGVGLGLYIVRSILDKHGEDISVLSKDGKTTFTFTLTPADKK